MFLSILFIMIVAVIMVVGYKKAPPDTAFIVSGLKNRTAIGRAIIVIPFLERIDKLNLKLIPVNVRTSSTVPTADYINLSIDAVVNVKISSNPDKLKIASENFLNQDTDYIGRIAREILEGNMREIVGKMKLEEMVSDRQKFAEQVRINANPKLAAMGLDIIAFTVQNFTDTNGIIADLGIDNISQIKKKAEIAKAQANMEIAIEQSKAEKQANDARVTAESEIAKKNAELALQKAALKKKEDIAKAEADAAYSIQQQEQRKLVEAATAGANLVAEKENVEVMRMAAAVQEQRLEAEIKKKAEAELYQRQKEAEAKKFEEERQAEAERFKKEQEAEGILAVGRAEADAIRLKGNAEAETMERKAEAYKKYTNAAIAEMLVGVLPDIAAKVAEPLCKIDKITIIGGSGDAPVDSVAGNVPLVMGKVFESIKETTGIDMKNIAMSNSYDAKVNKNINITGGIPVSEDIQASNSPELLE